MQTGELEKHVNWLSKNPTTPILKPYHPPWTNAMHIHYIYLKNFCLYLFQPFKRWTLNLQIGPLTLSFETKDEGKKSFLSSFLAWSKLVIKKSPHAKGLNNACADPLNTADTYKSILILAYHFRTPDAANDFSLASLKSRFCFSSEIIVTLRCFTFSFFIRFN